MNGFLVVCRTTLDELPIQLCKSMEYAKLICRTTTIAAVDRVAKIMDVDQASPIVNAVITFKCGLPTALDIVSEWSSNDGVYWTLTDAKPRRKLPTQPQKPRKQKP